MPAFDRCLLAASLALAFSLPASAQVKTTPAPAKPAAAPAGSANFKEVKLKTAMDGEVSYRFDNATNLPVSAKDDRAEVMATGLSFLPKKQGEGLRWAFYYALQFSGKVKPTLVTVYAENKAPMLLEVGDSAPVLDETGTWTASSKAQVVDKKTWDSMIGKEPWVLQRKFVISYADGTQRTLHQLSVVTQVMRLELLEKVTGQKLLEPAKK
jgi:hypothetical protein